ncbi:MFS transporter [Isoptericola sp. b441]|uniref:MFS transporter n=1 Tax=Actinotalea lenta TaxID=3064654 RepID=A0ABT9D6I9_9CELL|nr:MFS transporter [Isoptericola sp. b441]MDO8105981.1 MFS transporter [Isoptericola sp. b441]
MLRPYRDVLARPGALAFSLAGLLARLPISTVGIGVVLAVSARYGSYALAGRVAAVVVLTQALCGPPLSRLVDRHGQARVMGPAVVSTVLGLGVLAGTATAAGPVWLLYVGAVVVGATAGSVGALVRARWSHLLTTPAEVHTAYSWESTLDEVVFMVGPVLATVLATNVVPAGGLLLAAGAAGVGGWLLLAQRDTEPPSSAGADHVGGPSVVSGSLLVLVGSFVGMGAIFGATDVAVVAFTQELGRKPLAGVVLGVMALGSGLAGFAYGARSWTGPQWRRYGVGMVALGVGVGLFGTVGTIPALGGVMLAVGMAIAPTLIAGNGLVAELVPRGRLTEGLTWVGTALAVGVSAGSWAAGTLVDRSGSSGGFAVVMVAGGTAAVTTLLALPTLRRATAGAPTTLAVPDDRAGRPTAAAGLSRRSRRRRRPDRT